MSQSELVSPAEVTGASAEASKGDAAGDAVGGRDVPIYVDLDGTLISSDMLWETLWLLLCHRPSVAFRLPFWLLGGNILMMNTGVIGPTGQFRFGFRMPSIQSLVGMEFTGQAVVGEPAGLLITNADCKEVRDN